MVLQQPGGKIRLGKITKNRIKKLIRPSQMAASSFGCRLLAQPGHAGVVRRRLLLAVERTCRSSGPTSGFGPGADYRG